MHKLPNFLAKVGLGVFAEFAFTTLRHIQRYDSITFWGETKTEIKTLQNRLLIKQILTVAKFSYLA